MLPVTHHIDSLIGFKNVSMGLKIAGIYWFKIASYMPSVARSESRRRVVSMVVFRRQIYDQIHSFIASRFCWLNNGVDSWLGIGLVAEQEFIKSVVAAFDAVNCAISRVDLANTEDTAIAWWNQAARVIGVSNWTTLLPELSGKELVKILEWIEGISDFLKVDPVKLAKCFVHPHTQVRR